MPFLLWTLVLALWVPLQAVAQAGPSPTFPVLEITQESPGRMEVGARMGVLADPSGALTIDAVRIGNTAWQSINRQSPNYGFTQDAYWFRFQLRNRTGQELTRFIELPIPFLDHVHLYHFVDDDLKVHYSLGDEQPFAQRVVQHRNFVMPITLAPGSNSIFLRLASTGTIEAPLRIWNPVSFFAASNDEYLLQGAVIGILLIMAIYNLFVAFSTKDVNYLYFVGFVVSYLLFHLTLNGYMFAYVWPHAVRWNSFAISTFVACCAVFISLFTNHFLKVQSFSIPAYYLLQTITVFSAILFVLTFFLPYSWTLRIGVISSLPILATSLVLGYWRWWKGAQFARLYCLAWTAILIGLSVLITAKLGWIPVNIWTESASQIGIVLLVILLSFTLADQINIDRNLRLNAQAVALAHERKARSSQNELIENKERANQLLEARVQSRTEDLNSALEQLQLANERLLLLSTTDGLTNISNRAYFDTAVANELRRAERQQTAITIILMDIDHFKRMNDTYGHLAGDACLRALADVLRPRIHRAGDIFARYGGEEFVIALNGVNLSASLGLAEEFRTLIESLTVPFDNLTLHFTASFGVVSAVPWANLEVATLLAAADKALYEAKHAGRNCVRPATIESSGY